MDDLILHVLNFFQTFYTYASHFKCQELDEVFICF